MLLLRRFTNNLNLIKCSLHVIQNKHILLNERVFTRHFHLSFQLFIKKNYYEVLGVPMNASLKEIKTAYYELAKQFHPDANAGNDSAIKKFHDVSEAYHVLSDEKLRTQFDVEQSQPEMKWTTSASVFESFHSSLDPEEMFKKMFGDFENVKRKWRPTAQVDFPESKFGHAPAEEAIVHLSFTEAARGCVKRITVNVMDVCFRCNGTRIQLGYASQECPFCGGRGIETITEGSIIVQSTCRFCRGAGRYTKHPCMECTGKGLVIVPKSFDIPIPPGTQDGQTMRVEVEGNEYFVTFRVRQSKYFRVDRLDCHTDATISLSQALLGGTIQIEGIYAIESVEILPGTSSHKQIKLHKKGLRDKDTNMIGDHIVHIKINIPNKLSAKQFKLVKSYAQLEGDTKGTITGIETKGSDEVSAKEKEDTVMEGIKNWINRKLPWRIS